MNKKPLSYAMLYMSACLFAVNSVIVKIASETYSGIFISSIRFLFGIVFTASAILISGQGFRINNKKYWVLRGVAGAVAMISFYVAIHLTSSGRTAMIEKIYPIFVTILGFLFFREKISKGIIASLLLCTAGLFLIMYDGSRYNILGDLIAILSGIAASLRLYSLKRQGRQTAA
jgi:drug/metabolite transporter (DMT)-like permease